MTGTSGGGTGSSSGLLGPLTRTDLETQSFLFLLN